MNSKKNHGRKFSDIENLSKKKAKKEIEEMKKVFFPKDTSKD
ncbi:MAG: hypothetical protein RRA35_02600 [Desulfomonilia bacterium]|nr:hypothetical protein [Desulfomonilia bacterium]